jgi:hypothetical protein
MHTPFKSPAITKSSPPLRVPSRPDKNDTKIIFSGLSVFIQYDTQQSHRTANIIMDKPAQPSLSNTQKGAFVAVSIDLVASKGVQMDIPMFPHTIHESWLLAKPFLLERQPSFQFPIY